MPHTPVPTLLPEPELFLHRNTVNYRIQKIRSLVSMDTAIQKTRLLLAFYMNDVRPYL
ncbi:helix-turn-helix domain-containing protein [Jutongia huaianensis]|uniref:Helix-turn-helix domain-containing protein n=1 Tax=Jutongia huaianensis TaxID=2763668 RepID=A0ABR7N118_9FIRM|nr:helix-turn-helix domain-containing protein [Jutongia huaianensis]